MNKKGMGYIAYVFILLVLTIGFAVQQNPDMDTAKVRDALNWTDIEINVTDSPDLSHAFESFTNGLGEAAFSIAKWAIDWTADNPTIPFRLLIYAVLLAILAPIIVLLFKLIVIIVILIKEFVQSRREKKMLGRFK